MEGTQYSAPQPYHIGEEGGFIDMELIPSCSNLLKIRLSNTSPPLTRDFKFQMSSFSSSLYSSYNHQKVVENNREAPPQILINTTTTTSKSFTAPPTISNTPLDSCNISPIESRRVSCELNPTDYQYNFLEWSTEALSAFVNCSGVANGQQISTESIKSSWRKKLRLMKHSSSPRNLTHKLRTYFKSLHLISKPTASSVDVGATTNLCSNKTAPEKSGTQPYGNRNASAISTKPKEYANRYIIKNQQLPINKWRSQHQRHGEKQAATSSFIMKSMDEEDDDNQTTFTCHRRSFSGTTTTKRSRRTSSNCYYSTSSSSSSSLMTNSNSSSNCSSFKSHGNGFHHEIKRTVDLEEERSIEGAIAHCKMSQQMKEKERLGDKSGQRNHQQIGSCLLSAASRVSESNGRRSELCRI